MRLTPRRLLNAVAIAVVATSLSACSRTPAEPSPQAGPTVFSAQAVIPVNLSLLGADDATGRTSAISSNYRPQVRFPLGSVEAHCSVQLPASTPALEPGQSSAASLSCDAEIGVDRAAPEFAVFEGGKRVGHGTVQFP